MIMNTTCQTQECEFESGPRTRPAWRQLVNMMNPMKKLEDARRVALARALMGYSCIGHGEQLARVKCCSSWPRLRVQTQTAWRLQLMREKDVEFFQRVLIRRCAWVQSEPTLRTWPHPLQRLVPFLLHEPLEHTIVHIHTKQWTL
jgi:hypothetical protein